MFQLTSMSVLSDVNSPITGPKGPTGLQEVKVSKISRQLALEGCTVVSHTHQLPLPPVNAPGTHFCWRLNRPQGHSAIGRIPMKPAGIEQPTYRFVAQHLDHCATAGPRRRM